MFRIETKKDIALVRRAQNDGWGYDRKKLADALMDLAMSGDPELLLEAAAMLHKGDEVEIKRQLMELKKEGDDNAVRLRLLELARNIEPTELARLASENGLTS